MIISTTQCEYLLKFASIFDKSKGYAVEKIGKFGDRLRIVMNNERLTMREMGDKSGVSVATIFDYINKDREPKLQFFNEFTKSFPHISLSWLITGTGNMYINNNYVADLEERINTIQDELALYKKLANAMEKINTLETKGAKKR